jgi:hypothetical protein
MVFRLGSQLIFGQDKNFKPELEELKLQVEIEVFNKLNNK